MKFWDSSALVATDVDEESTRAVRDVIRSDPELVVWIVTSVEIASALWRRERSGDVTKAERSTLQDRFDETLSRAVRIADVSAVVRRARRVLGIHPLRAADAMQLAAALVACDDEPSRLPLVTLDDRLAEAARREGFVVLP